MPRTKSQKKRGVGKGNRLKLSAVEHIRKQDALSQFEHVFMHGVAFDTETTGLGPYCEIWEISAYDIASGQLLLTTLVKPSRLAVWEVTAHDMMEAGGITRKMLENAPSWPEVEAHLRRVIAGKILVAWSADAVGQEPFDRRLINQTRYSAGQGWLEPDDLLVVNVKPAHRDFRKLEYEAIRGQVPATVRGLSRAARVEGLLFAGKEHRAQADAEMLTKIVRKVLQP